ADLAIWTARARIERPRPVRRNPPSATPRRPPAAMPADREIPTDGHFPRRLREHPRRSSLSRRLRTDTHSERTGACPVPRFTRRRAPATGQRPHPRETRGAQASGFGAARGRPLARLPAEGGGY